MSVEEKREKTNSFSKKISKKKVKAFSSETKKSKNELGQLKINLEDLNDKYTRLIAEFDNYKKRTDKEYISLIQNANEKLVTDLLPVVDDLERSLDHLKEDIDFESMLNGFQLIHKNLLSLLEKQGLRPMTSKGEDFDPDKHEALMQVEDGKIESNKIVDEHLKGYLFNEKVIRHAQVIVAK